MSRASPAAAGSANRSQDLDDASVLWQSRHDPECFAVLFERHARAIGRYAARRLGANAAEDIVADTFLTAFRERGKYDLARPDARPWLYGIAGNLIRRHVRAEVRALRALERGGADPVAESFADQADARVTAWAVSKTIAAEIASLTAEQRDVLLLVAWADLTYDQVAEALGVPEGTVRSRMNRARTRLREALADLSPACISDGEEHRR